MFRVTICLYYESALGEQSKNLALITKIQQSSWVGPVNGSSMSQEFVDLVCRFRSASFYTKGSD